MLTHSISSGLPSSNGPGILNLDHYKYLRSLLPQVPHVIQSLVFSDLNNWECELYVNLLNESDSLKWLADFEEKTTTQWKSDKDATTALAQLESSRRSHWMMVYRCIPNESRKDCCTAKLEMRITGQEEQDRSNKHQKYPAQVSINFYHNHVTTENTIITMENFKAQDIPSHLKEGFEGYFQENMQPVTTSLASLTSTVNLSAIRPQQTLLSSTQLTHSLNNSVHQVTVLNPAGPKIKTENPVSPLGKHLDGKLQDLNEISAKLERTIHSLRCMLKENATSCAAVKHFVDKFDKLKSDQTQLEDALNSFGGQWDWLVAPPPQDTAASHQITHHTTQEHLSPANHPVPLTTVTAAATPLLPIATPLSTLTSLHSAPHPPPILTTLQPVQSLQLQQEEINKKKLKKKKKEEEEFQQTHHILTHHHHPPPTPEVGPESKRRKRARCGNCPSCLNRDKTQDCRQCRNCLDQKRYGGPGRLKKACIKRQCIVLSQLSGVEEKITQSVASNHVHHSQHHQQHQPNPAAQLLSQQQQAINHSQHSNNSIPVAIKTEPVQAHQVLAPTATIPLSVSSGSCQPSPNLQQASSTLISWPGGHYAPAFQVQVQPSFQFSFQPGAPHQPQPGIQYSASSLQQLTNSLPANSLQQLSLPTNSLQQLTSPNSSSSSLTQLTTASNGSLQQHLANSNNGLHQLSSSNNSLQQQLPSPNNSLTQLSSNGLQQLAASSNSLHQIVTSNGSILGK